MLAIRGDWLRPGFGPVVALAALPATALVLGLRRGARGAVAAAAAELVWSAVHGAMVGLAIGLRSG